MKTSRRMWQLALWMLLALTPLGLRAEDSEAAPAASGSESTAANDSVRYGLYAVGVGLAILGGALGTGLAQKGIGAAVAGAVAEDKKFLGTGLILLALPETILFICAGFAYLLFGKIH
jgi:F0F1-type ATP synthase membrane subunit c/vacuolar-type H+-ATPase subunit K